LKPTPQPGWCLVSIYIHSAFMLIQLILLRWSWCKADVCVSVQGWRAGFLQMWIDKVKYPGQGGWDSDYY